MWFFTRKYCLTWHKDDCTGTSSIWRVIRLYAWKDRASWCREWLVVLVELECRMTRVWATFYTRSIFDSIIIVTFAATDRNTLQIIMCDILMISFRKCDSCPLLELHLVISYACSFQSTSVTTIVTYCSSVEKELSRTSRCVSGTRLRRKRCHRFLPGGDHASG